MKNKKRILVAPLDWGIGHATRCIPIIRELIKHDFEVILAADGRPLHLLSQEFPSLELIRFSGYNMHYSTHFPMSISILLQMPKMMLHIRKEHQLLQQIITDYKIDGVISDNRYGLYSRQIPTVFITHQLQIQSPYFSEKIRQWNYQLIQKFDVCWIMDDLENNLAGKLSTPNLLPENVKYIGPQSRFSYQTTVKKYDFLAIISGPEPQRTVLEKGIIKALKDRGEKSLVVLGKPELNTTKSLDNLNIVSHLRSDALNEAILASELIICRPGYSTIMDLAILQKKAFFIPTPGQTEQEYLANHLMQKNIAYMQTQNQFDFNQAMQAYQRFNGFDTFKPTATNWEALFSLF